MKSSNTNTNATVNVYTTAIYAAGNIIGYVEMSNTDIARFNSDNRGELYAKALLTVRKEVKTA